MKKPELLAPAGNMESLEAVIKAGADAVYLGGKSLNMRQWRSDLNFSDSQILEAVEFAHRRGVKIYVTVNNLYFQDELHELADHLEFLEKVGVDALIAQDLAVSSLAKELGITRPLHASVQVGISSVKELDLFKSLGYTRAILCRDLSLEQVWGLSQGSDMELEYFIHGEFCTAHAGQCLLSGIVFGESSNRGRCMKPCRWRYRAFTLGEDGRREDAALPGQYLLASRDLNLFQQIPDLVQAGIVCFKIEGRMRPGSYLGPLVGAYRRAIDRYLEDPVGYRTDLKELEWLLNTRVREVSPGRALGEPGASLYDYSGSREPQFPTRPIGHHRITEVEINSPRWSFPAGVDASQKPLPLPRLSVKVSGLPAFEQALKAGAEVLYIGGETSVYKPFSWGRAEVREAVRLAHQAGARVVYTTPRIAYRREIGEYRKYLGELADAGVDGVLAANWGMLQLVREMGGMALYGDTPLNLANLAAFKTAKELGLEQAAASQEIPMEQLTGLINLSDLPVEVVVHGTQAAMTINHDLVSVIGEQALEGRERFYRFPRLYLEDEAGEVYQVEIDQYRRTHLLMSQQLCLLPYLPFLLAQHPASLRLELQFTDARETGRLVEVYRRHIDTAAKDPAGFKVAQPDWDYLKKLAPEGYTVGALGS